MKVNLVHKNEGMHFEALGESGHKVSFDASPAIGGTDKGVRPMESLLMALGGCSGIDVLHILRRDREKITLLEMEIDGEREPDVEPSLYKKIHVVYVLEGDLDPKRVKRAVDLSMEKYCSVSKTLEQTAEITHETKLNGELL